MSFKQQLIELKACREAINWVENRTFEQAWRDCHRGDWMLWLLEQMREKEGWLNEKDIMLLGCWCTRRALKYVPEEEKRPLKAIEAKEAWIRGETTREEMITARAAALDAAREAYAAANDTGLVITWKAANAAANAAASTTASVTAAFVAKAAEWAAKWASVNVSVWVDAWAANDEESLVQADYIRTQFILPKGNLCLSNNN
jgi:hypothetical protein